MELAHSTHLPASEAKPSATNWSSSFIFQPITGYSPAIADDTFHTVWLDFSAIWNIYGHFTGLYGLAKQSHKQTTQISWKAVSFKKSNDESEKRRWQAFWKWKLSYFTKHLDFPSHHIAIFLSLTVHQLFKAGQLLLDTFIICYYYYYFFTLGSKDAEG